MKARFVGGPWAGQYHDIGDNGGEPLQTWLVPRRPEPGLRPVDGELDELIGGAACHAYVLDGWYVRFSSHTHLPIYRHLGDW